MKECRVKSSRRSELNLFEDGEDGRALLGLSRLADGLPVHLQLLVVVIQGLFFKKKNDNERGGGRVGTHWWHLNDSTVTLWITQNSKLLISILWNYKTDLELAASQCVLRGATRTFSVEGHASLGAWSDRMSTQQVCLPKFKWESRFIYLLIYVYVHPRGLD